MTVEGVVSGVAEEAPEYEEFVSGLVEHTRREAWEPIVRYLLGEEVLCRELPVELRIQLPFEDDEPVEGLEPVVAMGRLQEELRRNAWAWYKPAGGCYAYWYAVYRNGYAIFGNMPVNAVWVDAEEPGKVFGWWPAGAGATGLVKLVIASAYRTIPPWIYSTYSRFEELLEKLREEGIAVKLRELRRLDGGKRFKESLPGWLGDYFEYAVRVEAGARRTVILFPTEDSEYVRIWKMRDVVALAGSEPWRVREPVIEL